MGRPANLVLLTSRRRGDRKLVPTALPQPSHLHLRSPVAGGREEGEQVAWVGE